MSPASNGPAPTRRNAATLAPQPRTVSEVFGKGADVRPLRAQHLDVEVLAIDSQHVEAVDGEPARLPLDHDALVRELVQALALVLQCGVHGGYLLDLATEPRDGAHRWSEAANSGTGRRRITSPSASPVDVVTPSRNVAT